MTSDPGTHGDPVTPETLHVQPASLAAGAVAGVAPDAAPVAGAGPEAVPTGSRMRRGLLRFGDRVQLTDPKGRISTIVLHPDGAFHTHKGYFTHSDLVGKPEGYVITNSAGVEYLVLRPLLSDYVLGMPRGAQVVYPKDAAQIVGMADIFPGAVVVEAGVGSGALTMSLLRAVGDGGQLTSIERREDFAQIARGNVENFFGGPHPAWRLETGDFADVVGQVAQPGTVDRVVLDMLAPWENIAAAAQVLIPGGVYLAYVATTTQLSRVAEDLRADGRFAEPVATETMLRGWHLEGLAVRPNHRMVAHTGFLITARRLADGVSPPTRTRRPAPAKESLPIQAGLPAAGRDAAGQDVPHTSAPDAGGQAQWTESQLGERPVSEKKLRKVIRSLQQ